MKLTTFLRKFFVFLKIFNTVYLNFNIVLLKKLLTFSIVNLFFISLINSSLRYFLIFKYFSEIQFLKFTILPAKLVHTFSNFTIISLRIFFDTSWMLLIFKLLLISSTTFMILSFICYTFIYTNALCLLNSSIISLFSCSTSHVYTKFKTSN